jgi:integrase
MYFSLDFGKVNGKRKFENFKTKKEAESAAEAARLRAKKFGRESLRLTADLLADAGGAWETLQGTGMSFMDAVEAAKELTPAQRADALTGLEALKGFASITTAADFYMEHHNPEGGTRKVVDVVKKYQAEAVQDGLRPRSLLDMQSRLQRFERDFGTRAIGTITRHDADAWRRTLRSENGQALSAVSVSNYCRAANGLFNYATDKGFAAENPFSTKGRTRRGHKTAHDEKMPEILTVDECESMLTAAALKVPEILPSIAIQLFCGLRTSEVQGLDWADVDFPAKLLTVSPRIAKKRRVRHVDMSVNLIAWLLPHRKAAGPVSFAKDSDYRSKFDRVKDAAGIDPWPSNALRHSFGSFHLARYNDANKTALLMGHRSTDVLFNHYRNLVKTEAAENFWTLAPAVDSVPPMIPKPA